MTDKLTATVNAPAGRTTMAIVQWYDEQRGQWVDKGKEFRLSANGNPWTLRLEPGEGLKIWDAGAATDA